MINPEDDVTTLLQAWKAGDAGALNRMIPLVERELRRIARGRMSRERSKLTLQTTGLANEAYIKLIDASRIPVNSRNEFYALASRIMRQILIDAARRRNRPKHGGGFEHISVDEASPASPEMSLDVIAIHEAMEQLAARDERAAKVVELRYFGGLTALETAEVLGISERLVQREWSFAQAWLRDKLNGKDPDAGPVRP